MKYFQTAIALIVLLSAQAFAETTAAYCHRFIKYDCTFDRKYFSNNDRIVKPFSSPFVSTPDALKVGGFRVVGIKEGIPTVTIKREREKGVLTDTRLVCSAIGGKTQQQLEQAACDSITDIDHIRALFPKGQTKQRCTDEFITKSTFFKDLQENYPVNHSVEATDLNHHRDPGSWWDDHKGARTYNTKKGKCYCKDILTENFIFDPENYFVGTGRSRVWVPTFKSLEPRGSNIHEYSPSGDLAHIVLTKTDELDRVENRLYERNASMRIQSHPNDFDIYPYNVTPRGYTWYMATHSERDSEDYVYSKSKDDWNWLWEDTIKPWSQKRGIMKRMRNLKAGLCSAKSTSESSNQSTGSSSSKTDTSTSTSASISATTTTSEDTTSTSTSKEYPPYLCNVTHFQNFAEQYKINNFLFETDGTPLPIECTSREMIQLIKWSNHKKFDKYKQQGETDVMDPFRWVYEHADSTTRTEQKSLLRTYNCDADLMIWNEDDKTAEDIEAFKNLATREDAAKAICGYQP